MKKFFKIYFYTNFIYTINLNTSYLEYNTFTTYRVKLALLLDKQSELLNKKRQITVYITVTIHKSGIMTGTVS